MFRKLLFIALLPLVVFSHSCGGEDSPQVFDCDLDIDFSVSECLAEDILNTCFFYSCENNNNFITAINRFDQDCEMINCSIFVCDETLFEDVQPGEESEFSTIIIVFSSSITNEEFTEEKAVCKPFQS